MEVDAVKHHPLTNSERERRKKNNLCLYCGNAGHKVNDCPELAKKLLRPRGIPGGHT